LKFYQRDKYARVVYRFSRLITCLITDTIKKTSSLFFFLLRQR